MPRERLILLAPITPAPGGNGLAMRCELFRRAAGTRFEAATVVVPVAGAAPEPTDAAAVVVEPDPDRARAAVAGLIASAVWRRRLSVAGDLPRPARAASPGLAPGVAKAIAERLPGAEITAVHVMRSYLAPLGVAVAERLGVTRLTLDLDEDDAAFAASVGDAGGARAYTRLLDAFGDRFDAISASAAREAGAVAARHGLRVSQIPNAVELPDRPSRRRPPRQRAEISLLFVGNLSYWPNVDAARRLVSDVLPAVRRRLRRTVRLRLVGPCDAQIAGLAGPDVEVTGFVSNLGPVYAAADVVVVPLRFGAGTRIKLLEAFAHGVPVAASPLAAAGLDVGHGRHLLLAEDAEQLAAAVTEIVEHPGLAERLAAQGGALVRERYSTGAVIPIIIDFLAPRGSSAGTAPQPAVPL